MFALYGTCTSMLDLCYQHFLSLSDSVDANFASLRSLVVSFAFRKRVCKGCMRHSWS